MTTYLNTQRVIVQDADWAKQFDIRDRFVEQAGAMLEGLRAAVIIGDLAVEQHGHPKGGRFIVARTFAERWTSNVDHYREYFNMFDVVGV